MSKCRAAAAKLPASTTCLNTAMLTSRSMVPLRNLASETPKRTTDCPAVSAPPLAVSRTSKGDNLDKEEIMRTAIDTVIVGCGQAGLSVSYYLARQGREHVVLEQADQPAEAWRNHRWDSFALNTPNWQTRLPGAEYRGDDPNGFMSRADVIGYLENYVERFRVPIRYGICVERVLRDDRSGRYLVETKDGRRLTARNVVIATGLYQTPKAPKFNSALPTTIKQVHSDAYRNPQELRPGAVLVVGSAQSGAQIAEELYQAGKKVYLAVGRS